MQDEIFSKKVVPRFGYLCGFCIFGKILGQIMENKKNISFKDLAVTQSNQLVEATYPRIIEKKNGGTEIDFKVTTRAHKVSRLIISLISPDDQDLRYYKVDISTLKSYLGYKPEFPNGKFYQDLKEIANRLNKQPIEIRPDPQRIITAYFISSYELNHKTGEITFEISGQLKPFLLQLKNNFTSVQLENIPRLSSGYSIRLYEILYQYKFIGKRAFDNIDRLQQMLGSSYGKYSHFKARVLEFAKQDITKNTNITFDYEEIKTGKKVTKLVFHIRDNSPDAEKAVAGALTFSIAQNTEGTSENDDTSLLGILKHLNINTIKINEYLKLGFDIIKDEKKRVGAVSRCSSIEAYYNEKIALLRHSKPDMDNPTGFLIKALQEDWMSGKVTKELDTQKTVKTNRDKHLRIKQLEKQIELAQKQYAALQIPIYGKLAAQEDTFTAAYNGVMSEFEEGTYFSRTIKDMATPRIAYQNSVALNSMMSGYFLKHYPDEFKGIQTIADAISKMKMELSALQA
jgi:plasmid replication initiation protein